MSSTVVRSKPCRSNRSNATCSRSAREVTGLRPARATGTAVGTGLTSSLRCQRRAGLSQEHATARHAMRSNPGGGSLSAGRDPCHLALGAVTVCTRCHYQATEVAMTQQAVIEATPAEPELAEEEAMDRAAEEALVADELLVEEVSIDGMCGVY